MQTKRYHLGDILSITTGRLVSPRHMDGVYDILNFMTGDDLYTHQLPRAADECRPYLAKQFPQLSKIDLPKAGEGFKQILGVLACGSGQGTRRIPRRADYADG
jgi:hypothetical protein